MYIGIWIPVYAQKMLLWLKTSSKTNGFRSGFRRFPAGFLCSEVSGNFPLHFFNRSASKRLFRLEQSHQKVSPSTTTSYEK